MPTLPPRIRSSDGEFEIEIDLTDLESQPPRPSNSDEEISIVRSAPHIPPEEFEEARDRAIDSEAETIRPSGRGHAYSQQAMITLLRLNDEEYGPGLDLPPIGVPERVIQALGVLFPKDPDAHLPLEKRLQAFVECRAGLDMTESPRCTADGKPSQVEDIIYAFNIRGWKTAAGKFAERFRPKTRQKPEKPKKSNVR